MSGALTIMRYCATCRTYYTPQDPTSRMPHCMVTHEFNQHGESIQRGYVVGSSFPYLGQNLDIEV